MKGFFRSKLILALAALVMLASAIVVTLSVNIPHSRAQNSITINPTGINGAFFPNLVINNGTFDVNPSTTPVFTQNFPAINFNPAPDMQNCNPSTGVDQNTRPFTDVAEMSNNQCSTTIAQGNEEQAGVGDLFNFESVIRATMTVPGAGSMTSTISADDGWIFSMGASNGNQPTPDPGNPMNNPPPNRVGPFTGFPEMGDYNLSNPPSTFTVTVNFPAAGTYPIELDYTECCAGRLTLTMNNSFTPSPTSNREKLFVFLQGFDSTLTADQAANNIIPAKDAFGQQPDGIAPYLMKTYPGSQLLMFSYKGDDGSGNPLAYNCGNTFTSHAGSYSLALAKQLADYLQGKSHVDVYLIGHSFGGVIAFGYLTYLDIHHAVNGIIPDTTDDRLAGVVTLDSPLGGVANDFKLKEVELIQYYHKDCPESVKKPAPAIDDLFDIYKTGNKLPRGGFNSISSILFGANFTNETLANRAAAQTIHVLTIGNKLDYIYDPDACKSVFDHHIRSDFRSTQWIVDKGDSSGVYSRVFSDGKPTCQEDIAVNHSVVFEKASVQAALGQFIDDTPVTALPAVE